MPGGAMPKTRSTTRHWLEMSSHPKQILLQRKGLSYSRGTNPAAAIPLKQQAGASVHDGAPTASPDLCFLHSAANGLGTWLGTWNGICDGGTEWTGSGSSSASATGGAHAGWALAATGGGGLRTRSAAIGRLANHLNLMPRDGETAPAPAALVLDGLQQSAVKRVSGAQHGSRG